MSARTARRWIRDGLLWRWRWAMMPVVAKPFAWLPAGQMPSRRALRAVQLVWGNVGYAAGWPYLCHVAEVAVRTGGPVLECGSGLTTVLLGLLGRANGFQVTALEHHPRWKRRVERSVRRLRLRNVTIHEVPITDYGEFEWYDVSGLEHESPYELVVCDGPPGRTRGGRVGMLPVMEDRLAPDAVIMLDDIHRVWENRALAAWSRRRPLECRRFGLLRQFAELRLT